MVRKMALEGRGEVTDGRMIIESGLAREGQQTMEGGKEGRGPLAR